MYYNFPHILSTIERYKGFEIFDDESIKYSNQNDVGFEVTNSYIRFISTNRDSINYDWKLKYSEIRGIAFKEISAPEFEKQLLLFFIANKETIKFTIPEITSEEMLGIENFYLKLNEFYDIERTPWLAGKSIIAYPKHLKRRELYGHWKSFRIIIIKKLSFIFKFYYDFNGVL